MPTSNDPAQMRELLTTPGRWAVVGLSSNRDRAAYNVSAYLQRVLRMEIVPVHPNAEPVHGAKGYASLTEVPGPIDVVDLFVNSRRAGAVIDEAIAVGAKAVWLQLDVVDEAATERARAAGLTVVVDACPAIEGPRLGIG
jgi:predicted CoA-binding protein